MPIISNSVLLAISEIKQEILKKIIDYLNENGVETDKYFKRFISGVISRNVKIIPSPQELTSRELWDIVRIIAACEDRCDKLVYEEKERLKAEIKQKLCQWNKLDALNSTVEMLYYQEK